MIENRPGQFTPAPWVNVLANPQFGSVVSESGGAYTWSENAHEFRLTPWANDPVTDRTGEAFYLRDEESGAFWSLSPLPARGPGPYLTRHGFGYSVFEHAQDGLSTSMTVHVAVDAPVKFWHVRIRNRSGRARTVTATGYVEWVLGHDPVRNRDARRTRARPPDRRRSGPELLQHRVPGPRGVLRRERA